MAFPFEKLEVYKKSIETVFRINQFIKELKGKVPFSTLDQLNRASLSIPLNIAEGSGRWGSKEQAHFYRIARGSVFEIVPIIQLVYKLGHLKKIQFEETYNELDQIAKMLTVMSKSHQSSFVKSP